MQLTENGAPARVRVGAETTGALKAEILRVLLETSRTMDVFEPLARVEAAVRLLWEEVPETPPTSA